MKNFLLNFYYKKRKLVILVTILLWFLSLGFFVNFSNDENNLSSKPFSIQKVSAADSQYEMFEKIPGQEKEPKDLLDYLDTIYKFGIAISAILAFVMISVASFVIMVSGAGNASKIGDAKSMVGDAIFGLILALTAYLFLYVINPDLLSANKEKQKTAGEVAYKEGTASKVSNNSGYKKACPNGNESENPIKYKKSPANEQSFEEDCSNNTVMAKAFEKYGKDLDESGDPGINGNCLLKALAQRESRCGALDKKPREVPTESEGTVTVCGLMQMADGTAKSLGHSGGCDQELVENDDLAVKLAADYINENKGSVSSLSGYDRIAGLIAGYNSGYAKVVNGKIQSLGDSDDCPGYLAFQCCINPGKLDESIGHAWNVVGLYKQCTGDGSNYDWDDEE